MFIVWIPQLLSSLNTANCNAVSDIVLRLAETYPQALIYIYRITKENYDIENNSGNLKNTVEQYEIPIFFKYICIKVNFLNLD